MEMLPPVDCQFPLEKFKKEECTIIAEILEKSYVTPEKDFCFVESKEHVEESGSEMEEVCIQYPITLKHDKLMGRCLVAARDIEAGEVFLNDWPIITAPNAGESHDTCLGCSVITEKPQACPRCGWPVCNEACSNIPQHAEFECIVFTKEGIKPNLPSPCSYIASAEYIKVLRCLLLKNETNPEKMQKWKQILSLEAHMDLRRNIPKVQFMSGLVKRFVQSICKLSAYDDPTIDFVLGVVDVNAFRHSFEPVPLKPIQSSEEEPPRNATYLYPQASMAAHGCIRNTDWKTLAGGQLAMRASHKILHGETILHAYVDLMVGTPERRRLLHNLFYFDCTCQRCSDPTEIGTYFSALKCTKCSTGYLIAENPLQYKSNWVCNNSQDSCNESKSYLYEKEVVQQILSEEKQVCDQIPQVTNLVTVRSLMKVLKQHRNITVHPNHYRLVSLEYTLARHLLQIPKPAVEIMLEIKRIIKKYMKLSSVFHPSIDD